MHCVSAVNTWNSRKCNEGIWSSKRAREVEANLLSMHYCFRDLHKKKRKTRHSEWLLQSIQCCSASEGQQHRGRWINCFTWWTLCVDFSIPESCQPKLQTLWVRSPHSALAASLSIFSLCEEIQASASIWTLPTCLLAKGGEIQQWIANYVKWLYRNNQDDRNNQNVF